MKKDSKLHLLLTKINQAAGPGSGSAEIINLTEELSHAVRGGVNGGCEEELPNDGCAGNNSCNNSACNSSNSPNTSCTNNSCATRNMTNTGCTNNSCTN